MIIKTNHAIRQNTFSASLLGAVFFGLFLISCEPAPKTSSVSDAVAKATEIRANIESNAKRIEENFSQPEIPDNLINLEEYAGKKADEAGTFDFYTSINQAVQELAEKGGGTLLLPHPQGQWYWFKTTMRYRVRGPLHLEDNIKILIDHGVELFFEFAPEAYLPNGKPVLTRWEGTMLLGYSPLVYAYDKENIVITARDSYGNMPRINGDGEQWVKWFMKGDTVRIEELGLNRSLDDLRAYNRDQIPILERVLTEKEDFYLRPSMFEFIFCKNIYMSNIHIDNSPFWTVHPLFSENLWFDGLFFTVPNVNNDGFDPESSKNIIIENCIFNNHDDNLAVKAGRNLEGREGIDMKGTEWENVEGYYNKNGTWQGPSFDIVMRNCTFKGHHAVTIGSEMSGGAHNIFVYDNVAPQDVHNLVYLKSSRKRGGYVRDVYVDNIRANKCWKVVGLIPNYDAADSLDPYVPAFSDVYVQNITAKTTGEFIVATGWPDKPIENVWLHNISVGEATKEQPIVIDNILNAQFSQLKYDTVTIDTTIVEKVSDKKPKASS